MTTTVVSGFNPSGYEEYGKSFIRTFDRHWPHDIKLVVYVEEPIKTSHTQRSVLDVPGCREFIEGHTDAQSNGKQPVPGWREKDVRHGYAWRYDAVRFCRQLFIPEHASSFMSDGDVLVWLDGDVVTFADVPAGLIENMIGDYDLIYMGRDVMAPELGFWAVKLKPNTRLFLSNLAECYRTESVFKLREWHSGFVFDHALNRFKTSGLINAKSLTSGHGHVWFQSDIGRYTDHLKGTERKQRGYSLERR